MTEALETIDNRMFGIKVEAKEHREEYDNHSQYVIEQLANVPMRRTTKNKITDKLSNKWGGELAPEPKISSKKLDDQIWGQVASENISG